ncbi:MAG: hypothetical protein WD341_00135 [Tistlia sp.]|uniref:hypothetical protein n=1 Tax=Tistlia sp. TaxID=3057121 RepID=UPI0034A23A2B
MRLLARLLGYLLLIAALAALAVDLLAWSTTGRFRLSELGALWAQIDRPSLNLVQAVLERHVWQPLWDGLFWVLLQPAVLVLGLPGLVLLLLGRRGGGRRDSHFSRR